MTLPGFTRDGLLPVGTHECTLHELENSLAFSDRRRVMVEGFKKFISELPEPGSILYVLVDGSFAESKTNPSDVDVVVVVDNLREGYQGFRLLQWVEHRHDSIKALMRCDAYVSDEAFINEYWDSFFGHTRDNRPKGKLKVKIQTREAGN